MADFRKWFLVLAVVAALAIPASAQTSFSCATTPTTPVLIRENGLAELVGAVQLECSGGTLGAPNAEANIQVFMSPTPVTNRVVANAACPTGFPCLTTATLTIATPGVTPVVIPGLLQKNLVAGAQNNSILFPSVSLPQGTTTTVRIENIRVAAPAVSSTLLPQQVFELVSTSPITAFPITNPQQLVAFVQPGLVFTTSTGNVSFAQCAAQALANAFNVTFTEGFPSAFKTLADEGPGADTGTLLEVVFNNIPAGVNIFVSNAPISGSATLVAERTDTTGTVSVGGVNYAPVTISSGTGTAIWEVTAENPLGTQESATFGVAVSFAAGAPGLTGSTPGTVAGLLGPTSAVETASTIAPIPRFRLNQNAGSVTLSIVPCVTNLLFPFVTNQAGFDTGIALVNTSLDNAGAKQPFNTNTQSGACTVYYFDGTTTAPAPQTTASIPAGGMVAFTLQGGGVAGSTSSAAGFQGYAIVRCNFQYAHGFAFISDRNTPSLGSQGYLALVIPDRGTAGRPADPFSTAAANSGEMLVQ